MFYENFYNNHLKQDLNADILIVVEHTVRELDSAIILMKCLNKKGYKVAIDSPKWNINRLPLMYKPHVVFVPWAYTDKELFIWKQFVDKNGQSSNIINLHHEQITGSASSKFIEPRGSAINEVYHLSWGSNFTKKLEKICKPNLILPYGNMRLDYIHKSMRNFGPSKNDLSLAYNLDESKKWILFISNSFHLQKRKEQEFFEKSGVSILNLAKVGALNTMKFLEFAKKTLTTRNDVIFIYRPHPSMIDREKKFHELVNLKKEFNESFHVIGELSAGYWIRSSSHVLTFHSTCIAEAAITNSNFSLIRIQNPKKEDDPKIFNNVNKIANYDDFTSFINYDNAKIDIESLSDYYYYYYQGDDLASEKMASFIDELIKGNRKSPLKKNNFYKRCCFYLIFIIKFFFNYLSFKFSFVKNFLLANSKYRVNNFAYLTGSDAYSLDDINKTKSYFE